MHYQRVETAIDGHAWTPWRSCNAANHPAQRGQIDVSKLIWAEPRLALITDWTVQSYAFIEYLDLARAP